MADLVALDLDGGPDFVDAVARSWERGDAVLPLDRRAPLAHRQAVLRTLAPTMIVDADGERRRLDGGRPVEPGDAVVIPTSGTTGAPKGVVLTHAAVEYAAFATATALGVGADIGWLACLPLFHVAGLGVVTRAMHTGVRLDVHALADGPAIDAAARRGLTHVSLVPDPVAPHRPGPVAGHPPRRIRRSPRDRPVNSVATYGMTETFGGVVYDGLPLNGVEMRIVDSFGTRSALDGGPGPIELRSPTLLRAYRDGTDPVGPGGWLRTGDVGSIDPSGPPPRARASRRPDHHGRRERVAVRGGGRRRPRPTGRRGGGRRDGPTRSGVTGSWRWSSRRIPADPPSLDDLRALVKEHLPVAAAPKEVILMEALPRTALGKISRAALDGTTGQDDVMDDNSTTTDFVFDHVAIAVERITDLWPTFAAALGGRYVDRGIGSDFEWTQLRFANGFVVEGLQPVGAENGAFLHRFLARNGPGPHHITFKVPDLDAALERVRERRTLAGRREPGRSAVARGVPPPERGPRHRRATGPTG